MLDISIHAPTWGATSLNADYLKTIAISIHAPTWGATSFAPHCEPLEEFQSTHPRGVRQLWEKPIGGKVDFNPRTHVGCDITTTNTKITTAISIHAPTWGATSPKFLQQMDANISIHAPTWGATYKGQYLDYLIPISIHAPTWGATSPTELAMLLICYFNPRTHVGCDH